MAEQIQFEHGPRDLLAERVKDVVQGKGDYPAAAPMDARRVLLIIAGHRGRASAVPLEKIGALLSLGDREIKQAVKTLRDDFAMPIGASRVEPYGYFLCETAEDLAAAVRPLVHEIRSLARTVKMMTPDSRMAELAGQLEIEAGKES